jgi:choline dehydrogenase-like flavoprotein
LPEADVSALGDVASALIPPELGGPSPERVASVARRLLDRMPAPNRAALGAGLIALEGLALARHGRPLGRLPHQARSAILASIGESGPLGAAALDAIKAVVLMAAGADEYAGAIRSVATAEPPTREDPPLRMLNRDELRKAQPDAIVIGSGAGGAFSGRELARAGLDVLILEEGERWDAARMRSAHPIERFAGLYRDAGSTIAAGVPPIALPVGRAVGGTTVLNSGTCFRPPDSVIAEWSTDHGLDGDLIGVDYGLILDDVEETIGVAPVPLGVMGRNGRLALAGAEALGLRSGPLRRNATGCRGSCQCAIGCPNNAKGGVHVNALPQACDAGAAIASGVRVERLLVERGRAVGVRCRLADGERVELRAPRIVVAAGTTETPPLLRRSGLASHPRLGRGMSIHPALSVTGRFAEPVVAWEGVMQSAGVEEFHEREGILLEATSTPPGMGSMVLPGVGAELLGRLEDAEHLASLGAMIADEPSGAVLGSSRPLLGYRVSRRDAGRLVAAAGHSARILLAAGAIEVELGGGTRPVRSEAGVAAAVASLDVRRMHIAAFHPTGTAAAGSDAARHPVAPDGTLRGVRGVWVSDGAIVPSCPTVNPQVSIMSLAIGVGRAAAAA